MRKIEKAKILKLIKERKPTGWGMFQGNSYLIGNVIERQINGQTSEGRRWTTRKEPKGRVEQNKWRRCTHHCALKTMNEYMNTRARTYIHDI